MKKVLISSDDKQWAPKLSRVLLEKGFEVTAVPNGYGLDGMQEEFDCAVVDFSYSGPDQIGFCQILRKESEGIHIVGVDFTEDAAGTVHSRYNDNPVNPKTLAEWVQSVVSTVDSD